MTAVYTIAGVALIVAGLVIPPAPWVVIWGAGVWLVLCGYWRHQDPARRAQRRARARRGYVRIRP